MQVLDLLKKDNIDVLVLFPGANIAYYTGFPIGMSERLAAAVIPVEDEPYFVVNKLEGELRGLDPWFKKVYIWEEHNDPVELLADATQIAQINVIAERFILSSNSVENIFLAAAYVEGESGYNKFDMDRYNNSLLSNNFLHDKAFQPGNEEASRMKILLNERQIIMDKLNDLEKGVVVDGISIWMKGYDQASNDIIVTEINDVRKYQACLETLGFGHLYYSVTVPDEFEGECESIKEQLGERFEVVASSSLRFAHEKTVRRRKSRLKVSVKAKGTSLKTKTTFAMTMFYISVSLHARFLNRF